MSKDVGKQIRHDASSRTCVQVLHLCCLTQYMFFNCCCLFVEKYTFYVMQSIFIFLAIHFCIWLSVCISIQDQSWSKFLIWLKISVMLGQNELVKISVGFCSDL